MEVRDAETDDAPAIGDAYAEAWRVGYSELFDENWLHSAAETRRKRWSQSLPECLASGTPVLVAETDRHVVGFVHFGPSEGGMGGEVFALYVRPDYWGTGAAQMLSAHAITRLRAEGFGRVVLWTLSGAKRAQAFYDHNGWALTGRTATRDFGDGRPMELVEYTLKR